MLQNIGIDKQKVSENKAFSPKMVRELLKIDNDRIISLCKKISLVPKKNAKGQTYFSRDDVRILKRVQELHSQTDVVRQKALETTALATVNQKPIERPAVIDEKLAKTAIDTIDRLNTTLSVLENNISNKIMAVLDEKLDGMDDVVMELIRVKTENETMRFKINELNKENYRLKKEVNSFKKVPFGFYAKTTPETHLF